MKKCPFCAEEIQDEAIKCRYCSEMLDAPRAAVKVRAADVDNEPAISSQIKSLTSQGKIVQAQAAKADADLQPATNDQARADADKKRKETTSAAQNVQMYLGLLRSHGRHERAKYLQDLVLQDKIDEAMVVVRETEINAIEEKELYIRVLRSRGNQEKATAVHDLFLEGKLDEAVAVGREALSAIKDALEAAYEQVEWLIYQGKLDEARAVTISLDKSSVVAASAEKNHASIKRKQSPVVQVGGGGSPAVREPVQVTDKDRMSRAIVFAVVGGLCVWMFAAMAAFKDGQSIFLGLLGAMAGAVIGYYVKLTVASKNAGVSPSSKPTPNAAAGGMVLLVVSFFLMMSIVGGSHSQPSTTQSTQTGSYSDGFDVGKGVGYSAAGAVSNRMTIGQMEQLCEVCYAKIEPQYGTRYADGYKAGMMEGLELGNKGKRF